MRSLGTRRLPIRGRDFNSSKRNPRRQDFKEKGVGKQVGVCVCVCVCGSERVRACPAPITLLAREEERKKKKNLPSPHRHWCWCKTVGKKRRGNAPAAEELRRRLEGRAARACPRLLPAPHRDGERRGHRHRPRLPRHRQGHGHGQGRAALRILPSAPPSLGRRPPAAAPAPGRPRPSPPGLGEVWPCGKDAAFCSPPLFPLSLRLSEKAASAQSPELLPAPCMCFSLCASVCERVCASVCACVCVRVAFLVLLQGTMLKSHR